MGLIKKLYLRRDMIHAGKKCTSEGIQCQEILYRKSRKTGRRSVRVPACAQRAGKYQSPGQDQAVMSGM